MEGVGVDRDLGHGTLVVAGQLARQHAVVALVRCEEGEQVRLKGKQVD